MTNVPWWSKLFFTQLLIGFVTFLSLLSEVKILLNKVL